MFQNLPHPVPECRAAFLALASHCTVHNTLTQPANIEIALDSPVGALV